MLIRDLKFAVRMLRKNPGFTAIAVLTIGVGIGVNTAMFSVVYGVLIQPLPFPNADRMCILWDNNLKRGVPQALISYTKFSEWRDGRDPEGPIESISAYTDGNFDLKSQGSPEQVRGSRVSAAFCEVIGAKPSLGRGFQPEEDVPGGNAVALLSNDLWQRSFGGSPSVVGQTVTLDGSVTTIIGVMPAGFHFPYDDTMLWVPRVFDVTSPAPARLKNGAGYLGVIARLRPEAQPAQAHEEIQTINDSYRQRNAGNVDAENGSTVQPLIEAYISNTRQTLLILEGAVLLVLLIACANVASMLLARTAARNKEMAVRLALGATRRRLIEQLVAENVLLSLFGGALGIPLAVAIVRMLVAFNPGNIPRLREVGFDAGVLGASLAMALGTGVVVGLVPAFQASRTNLSDSLKEGGRSSTSGVRGSRMRLIVIAEMGLAVTLLIGAGLLVRSFTRLQTVDPGFNPTGVLTMQIALPKLRYPDTEAQARFFRDVLQRVDRLPSVQSAGVVNYLPLAGSNAKFFYNVEGRPRLGPGKDPLVAVHTISPGYFESLGIPILRGRGLNDQDVSGKPKVVIINNMMARTVFDGEDPIGKRLAISADYGPNGWMTVVGVAGDVKHSSLNAPAAEAICIPYEQAVSPSASMCLVVKSSGDASNLSGAVRQEVEAVDSDQAVSNIRLMTGVVSTSLGQPRFAVMLLGGFAGVALLLAALGIYGVMAYSVSQRTNEIGIRMALGASRGEIFKLLMMQGIVVTVIGMGVGMAVALYASRVMQSLLFGVSEKDLGTFVVVPVILIFVALLACYVPALKGTKVGPVIALKYE